MNEWGWNPQTISVVVSAVLLLNVFLALRQLSIARGRLDAANAHLQAADSARLAQILFKVWDKYDDADMLEDVRNLSEMLEMYKCKTLVEFNDAAEKFKQHAGKKNFNADNARRRVKSILAPLGYLLKRKIAEPEEIFPIVPAAIRLWDKGLRDVELQLLDHTGGKREYVLGYDPVAMVDFLYQQYSDRVNKDAN